MIQLTRLRCEYAHNPSGIDVARPRLSWQIVADRQGMQQSAYQVHVANSRAALDGRRDLLWDSGQVRSDRSIQIEYGGPALTSRQRVWWTVRVWDENGQEISADNAVAWWEMGLLSAHDWHADWIGAEPMGPPVPGRKKWQSGSPAELIAAWNGIQQRAVATARPCAFLRKSFQLHGEIERARIYASARGIYQLYINGQRVGEDYFRPGWTDYQQRIQYQTYDITALLTSGENVVGIVLADGWFCGVLGGDGLRNLYGSATQALVQLEIVGSDGSSERICSDASWTTAQGPFVYADFYMGEYYDARREFPGWSQANFAAEEWRPVIAAPRDSVALVAQCGPAVQSVAELVPKTINEVAAGTYIFDLGQNMVGWVRLRVHGMAGSSVQLRHGEMLNSDGTLYTTNLRSVKATDIYVLKGSEQEEVYEPTFTFHGFRYVEVTGYPGVPTERTLRGIVLQSATPPAGTFECSSALVNQLVKNIEWGQRGNFLEAPTDCPQRDERLGWMGDAQIFIRTATYNADVAGFFSKWLRDIADAQHPDGGIPNIIPSALDNNYGAPGWANGIVSMPWTLARVYGDTRLLAQYYDMMARWINLIDRDNPTHRWRVHRNGNGNGQADYGDWLSVGADTPKDVLADAFWANSVALLTEIAETLGKVEDVQRYSQLFQQIKAAFNADYVSADGRISGDTQTVYALALSFQLLPIELRPLAVRHLVDDIQSRGNHLSTGFLGVGHLLPALTEHGQAEVAYQLLLQESYPSWGYSIRQGATTIWERWDGWTEEKGFQSASMNSFNHYSLGSVGEWLYRYAAGIDTAAGPRGELAGYKHILLHPYPSAALTFVHASYASPHGEIVSDWHTDAEGAFYWRISIPANTTATITLPATAQDRVMESRGPAHEVAGITLLRREKDAAIYHIVAGNYHFSREKIAR